MNSVSTIRNVAIVLVIAALVVILPGGGTGAQVALQTASIAFLATLVWFASIMYRQHRVALYSLGDRRRAILYGALAVATLTLTGTVRLWASTAGVLVWCVLVVACAYTMFAVIWSARQY